MTGADAVPLLEAEIDVPGEEVPLHAAGEQEVSDALAGERQLAFRVQVDHLAQVMARQDVQRLVRPSDGQELAIKVADQASCLLELVARIGFLEGGGRVEPLRDLAEPLRIHRPLVVLSE